MVLALVAASCVSVQDPTPEPDTAEVVLVDPSDSTPDADAPVTAPPGEPRNSEPPCDDDGDCCPEGTTAVLGTQGSDVFTTSSQGLCHVTLGGSDVVNNTSAAGLHAALGGPGTDTLYGGFGPAILAGGDDGDTLNGRNSDDELYGQGGNDTLNGSGGNDKGFGGDGNDTISLGEGNNEADGGAGTDTLNTGGGADLLRGGPGNDVLNAGGGADDLRGNGGDDTLNGQGGNDTLVGGPGKDIVNAGSGDDTVIVYDVCELVAGEVYNGEGGNDTLQIPVTLAEVQALGAVFTGFENVVFELDPEASQCGLCGCVIENGDLSCCNDRGTCSIEGDEQDFIVCACDPGFGGSDCGYDPSETFFGDEPPAGCQPDDPSCWRNFDADDALQHIDLGDTPECADLGQLAEQPDGGFDVAIWYPTPVGVPETWAAGDFPILLMAAGNGGGTDETEYAPLLSHLARNGVIAAVGSPPSHLAKVAARGEMLHCMRRVIGELVAGGDPVVDHHDGRLAYAGHSRGGEAAVIATMLDAELALPEVDALVSLAPTAACAGQSGGGDCGYPPSPDPESAFFRSRLEDGVVDAFLVMEGSRDGDRTGEGVALLDIAAEERNEPIPADATIKAMQWVFDVEHLDWRGDAGTRGRLMGQAYVLSFLQWHTMGATAPRSFFTGDAVPPCVADPMSCGYGFGTPEHFPQFREGGTAQDGRRQIVRHFVVPLDQAEGTGPLQPTGDVALKETIPPPPDTTSQTYFRYIGLSLAGEPGEPAAAEFGLAGFDGDPFPLDSLGRGLSHLSFRLAMRTEGAYVPPQFSTDLPQVQAACDAFAAQNARELNLGIMLEDIDGHTKEIQSADVQRVLAPHIAVVPSFQLGGGFNCEALGFWTTVRVPLALFSDQVDLTSLKSVRLTLDTSDPQHEDTPVGAFLDSVELVGNVLDPVCGNDLVEGNEECDGPDLDGESCASLGEGDGALACTDTCTFDVGGCNLPGDCEFGEQGCPGGPCNEDPDSEGVAAYWQDGRYCNDPTFICREDNPGDWTCHNCVSIEDSGEGCPCEPDLNGADCRPGLDCFGVVPDLQGLDSSARGACWDAFEGEPPGYCEDLCASTARVCGSTVGETTVCLIPDCADEGYCEFQPGPVACDRDAQPDAECVPVCEEFINPCEENQVCTAWGECWG
jgi:hypothetical protein